MGSNTPNHSFYKPDGDETGWSSEVNANFDSLDTDTLIKDTYANRPADPPSDTWFLATDRRIFYRYDGASWDAIAGAGTAANPLPEQHVTATTTESLGIEYPGGSVDNLTGLVETEDTTTSSIFDMDETGLDAHDVYIVRYHLQEHSASGNNVNVRIEADSGTNYAYADLDGTFSDNQTEWKVGAIFTDLVATGYVVIYGGGNSADPSADNASFYSRSSRATAPGYQGRYKSSVAQVADIRLFTGGNATGKATIMGYDYP